MFPDYRLYHCSLRFAGVPGEGECKAKMNHANPIFRGQVSDFKIQDNVSQALPETRSIPTRHRLAVFVPGIRGFGLAQGYAVSTVSLRSLL